MMALAVLVGPFVRAPRPLLAQPDSSGVKYGKVWISGENPVIRLLPAAGAPPTTDASFWRVIYSPAGMGHVLFLRTGSGSDAIRLAFTDNEKLAEYVRKEIMSAFNKVYVDDPYPVRKATFASSGNTLSEWKETVKADGYTIELIWRDFAEPFQLDTPTGGKANPFGIASFFIPARSADVIINGKKSLGHPYATKRGRMENSTAFLAFSETWVR